MTCWTWERYEVDAIFVEIRNDPSLRVPVLVAILYASDGRWQSLVYALQLQRGIRRPKTRLLYVRPAPAIIKWQRVHTLPQPQTSWRFGSMHYNDNKLLYSSSVQHLLKQTHDSRIPQEAFGALFFIYRTLIRVALTAVGAGISIRGCSP